MRFLLWILYFYACYAIVPGFLSRKFGFKTFNRGHSDHEVALTFDDGPDPRYTPELLDLLKEHRIKATFFIVGSHAEHHEDILQRMHKEGHLIGIHNYVHQTNWLMRPKTVRDQLKRTADIIQSVTGERPVYYRPPWGIVNIFDYSLTQYHIILWSAMFNDWKKKVGVDGLLRKMRRKLEDGAVFLLHDCGQTFGADEEAPGHTIEALRTLIPEAKNRGYSFIRVDKMLKQERKYKELRKRTPLWKRCILFLWLLWERLFHVLFRVEEIDPDHHFFHLRKCRYNGEPLLLGEGVMLRKGDYIAELHFDNELFSRWTIMSRSMVQIALRIVREMKVTMPYIAKKVREEKRYQDVKALYGVTMVHKGAESFGFQILEPPQNIFIRMSKVYLGILLRVIHPEGGKRLHSGREDLSPKILLLGKSELLRLYSTDEGGPV